MTQQPANPSPTLEDALRWIGTKNPFYAISAALVLWGLWVSFGKQSEEVETWLLMGGLAGYTLLLAGTAFVLVRYLKLWEDARTVLLLVVLMFLATSVTFDHVLVVDPERGTACYLLGLAMSVLVSEALLRGIRLRLPPLYRVPYYLILGLFFLYPIFLRNLLVAEDPLQEPIMWGLFGFPTAAGLVFLTLLPALRRGADYVRDHGSPLPWPLYPWSLFGVLAIAVPGRAILMCWSLHPLGPVHYDRLIFGPFFLIPFGFALAVLLLEMGLVLPRSPVVQASLVVPIFLVGLALVGHSPADPVYRVLRVLTTPLGNYRAFGEVRREPDPVYAEFLQNFSARLGADPLFWTVALSACFYGYAAARRVPLATEGLSVALAAMSLVATDTLSEGWQIPPEPGPLLAPAVLQLARGVRRRNAWNLLFGAVCVAGVIALAVPLGEPPVAGLRPGIFVHLTVLAMLALGAVFSDWNGMVLRRVGACGVLLLALAVMHEKGKIPDSLFPSAPIVYPLIVGILLAVYGQILRHSFSLVIATIILGYWVFKFGWTAYRAVRGLLQGFDYIACGLGFFIVAVLVSMGKAGVLTRWIEARWGPQDWLRRTPAVEPAVPDPTAAPLDVPQAQESGSKPETGMRDGPEGKTL